MSNGPVLMASFPCAEDQQVTLANWRTAPFNNWAFHHVREIVPSAEIRHDPARVRALEPGPSLVMPDVPTREGVLTYEKFAEQTHTDGLVVLHQGKLIHESYRNGMDADSAHILMSVSKSMLGLVAGVLADQGKLDLAAPAEHYVPELRGAAFEGASVRDLLDMRTGVVFDEDYLLTEGPIVEYRKSTNWNPLAPGQSPSDLRSFLASMQDTDCTHGGAFRYVSPCTDLLGWIIERAAGKRYHLVFQDELWRRLGAENAAYITVDRLGAPRCAGGLCMTTRDLARIGQMVADGGQGIIPTSWIEDIARSGDPQAWDSGNFAENYPGLSMHYRAKWYVVRDRGPLLMCHGIHGQHLFVDLARNLVVARFASQPLPTDPSGERLALRLFEAIRDSF